MCLACHACRLGSEGGGEHFEPDPSFTNYLLSQCRGKGFNANTNCPECGQVIDAGQIFAYFNSLCGEGSSVSENKHSSVTMCKMATHLVQKREGVENGVQCFDRHIRNVEAECPNNGAKVAMNLKLLFATALRDVGQHLAYALGMCTQVTVQERGQGCEHPGQLAFKASILMSMKRYREAMQAIKEGMQKETLLQSRDKFLKIATLMHMNVKCLKELDDFQAAERECRKLYDMSETLYGSRSQEKYNIGIKVGHFMFCNGDTENGVEVMLDNFTGMLFEKPDAIFALPNTKVVLECLCKCGQFERAEQLLENVNNQYIQYHEAKGVEFNNSALGLRKLQMRLLVALGQIQRAVEAQVAIVERCFFMYGKVGGCTLTEIRLLLDIGPEHNFDTRVLYSVRNFLVQIVEELKLNDQKPGENFVGLCIDYSLRLEHVVYMTKQNQFNMHDLFDAKKNAVEMCRMCYGSDSPKLKSLVFDLNNFKDIMLPMEALLDIV